MITFNPTHQENKVDSEPKILDAILRTVSYADIFNHPLAISEVYRFLDSTSADEQTVARLIASMISAGQLKQDRATGWVALPGHESLFNLRLERNHRARALWRQARAWGKLIGRLPFVRMVAVTGSLAVDNPDEDADIDLFIMTAPGRLWLARLCVVALVRIAAQFGVALCPNYFITSQNVTINGQNLYTAREICQMVPLVGQDEYAQFWQANRWTGRFFPNARPYPHPTPPAKKWGIIEWCLSRSLGGRLENWEMKRKIEKLASKADQSESDFSAEQCKGHFDGHQAKTLEQLSAVTASQSGLNSGPHAPQTDILFGQSYYLRFDPKLYAAMQPYPPLGTMIAAAMVREAGYSVDLFDGMLAESTAEWGVKLAECRPKVAVIYEDNFNYLSKMCLLNMRDAALEMISMAKSVGSTVILCGSDATDHPSLYLNAGADYVIQGEGEATLLELLKMLKAENGSTLPTEIQGLAFLQNGQMVQNSRRPVMRNIDQLPFPAWDLINVEKYRQIWVTHHGYFSMNMVTTRGCPYHCNWCAKPIWGQRYNARSAASVAAEMAWLKQTYAPDHIWFVDDIMGLKPGWWQDFAAETEKLGSKLPFKCLSRADLIVGKNKTGSGNVAAMAKAGCDIVWLGAESGAQHILNKMDKGTTVEQIYQAADELHKGGIKVAFFLQFGYPGETRDDIEKTLQMVRDCQPDDVGMSVSYPLPGTRFHENVKLQLGGQQNWTDSADLAMMYSGPFVTDFYRQLHVVLHKEFRSHKGWHQLKAIIRQPAQWRPKHGRELLAIGYRMATLPFAKAKLNRLAHIPQKSVDALPHMPLAEAALPSKQE